MDIRKVMETGILPKINTVLPQRSGVGGIGAGILRAPEKHSKMLLMHLANFVNNFRKGE
jgi:hypothetical protein